MPQSVSFPLRIPSCREIPNASLCMTSAWYLGKSRGRPGRIVTPSRVPGVDACPGSPHGGSTETHLDKDHYRSNGGAPPPVSSLLYSFLGVGLLGTGSEAVRRELSWAVCYLLFLTCVPPPLDLCVSPS